MPDFKAGLRLTVLFGKRPVNPWSAGPLIRKVALG